MQDPVMPEQTRSLDKDKPARKRGWVRHLPLIIIVLVALAGAVLLRDRLSFDLLKDNRDALLAFRDSNFAGLAISFVLVYVLIVAFSLPGATVTSVTGGFLFGLPAGTALNVFSATAGAALLFLAARAGLGRTLAARIDASEGRLKKVQAGLQNNEVSVLLLLRLVPAVPFFVANLLPALVGVLRFSAREAVALNLVASLVVLAAACPSAPPQCPGTRSRRTCPPFWGCSQVPCRRPGLAGAGSAGRPTRC